MRKISQFSKKNNKMIFFIASNTYFLITKKFLLWIFPWRIRSFLNQKVEGKDNIYWLLKSYCFELFGNGKHGVFWNEKVDGKMIFTDYWKRLVLRFFVMENMVSFSTRNMRFTSSFLSFRDIPGLGKDGFLCNDPLQIKLE